MKYVYIDFEYYGVTEPKPTLVCCSLQVDTQPAEEYWLLNDKQAQEKLRSRLEEFRTSDHAIVTYAGTAEGSSFNSLGVPRLWEYQVIDLHAEYRGLLNHSEYAYGAQLVEGNIKYTEPKLTKWEKEQGEEQQYGSDKASSGYAAACFKMLGVRIDTQHKTEMRDIIISANDRLIEYNKQRIMDYCSSDIKYLPELKDKILSLNGKLICNRLKYKYGEYMRSVFDRGRLTFSSCTYMGELGLPINHEALKNLSENIEEIYSSAYADASMKILKRERFTPFYYSAKERLWKTREASLRSWIGASEYADRWPKTNSGEFSLASDSFDMFSNERHAYSDNLISQMRRILALKSSLNSMRKREGKRHFFDAIGSDNRSRPYLNPFGTQSARFAPPATQFLLAKTAWLRSLCNTEPGEIMLTIDYSSQEFLLSAVLANDTNMMEAYADGDVYLYTAKLAKAVPQNATKKSHPKERQMFKAVVLGVSYLMGEQGLADELEPLILTPEEREVGPGKKFKNSKEKNEFCREEATELLSLFWEAYPELKEYMDSLWPEYSDDEGLATPQLLFPMHELNKNRRSVSNVKTQGSGAAILVNLLDKLTRYGFAKYNKPIVTNGLHDAVYMALPFTTVDNFKEDFANISEMFIQAYWDWVRWLGRNPSKIPPIRVAGEAWGSWVSPKTFPEVEFEETSGIHEGELDIGGVKVSIASLHRDERVSIQDFLDYTQYLKPINKDGWD